MTPPIMRLPFVVGVVLFLLPLAASLLRYKITRRSYTVPWSGLLPPRIGFPPWYFPAFHPPPPLWDLLCLLPLLVSSIPSGFFTGFPLSPLLAQTASRVFSIKWRGTLVYSVGPSLSSWPGNDTLIYPLFRCVRYFQIPLLRTTPSPFFPFFV